MLVEKNNHEATALLQAAWQGRLWLLEWLLQHGASLAEKNNHGYTALLAAVWNDHFPLIKWLIDRGALIAQSLTFDEISIMLELDENCMDNKDEPVTREMLGFATVITTLEELVKSNEFINRVSDDNYVLNLILRCHHLLRILIASDKKLVTTLKNKLMLLSGYRLQYLSAFSLTKPILENKTEHSSGVLSKELEDMREATSPPIADLISQLYYSIPHNSYQPN